MVVGLQVLINAISSIFQGGKEPPNNIAGYVGVFSAIAMYFVYRYNKKLAIQINSKAVMAASKDNISDAWVSLGASVRIFGAQLNMPWLDTLTAFIVGVLICKTAWDIFRQASNQ